MNRLVDPEVAPISFMLDGHSVTAQAQETILRSHRKAVLISPTCAIRKGCVLTATAGPVWLKLKVNACWRQRVAGNQQRE